METTVFIVVAALWALWLLFKAAVFKKGFFEWVLLLACATVFSLTEWTTLLTTPLIWQILFALGVLMSLLFFDIEDFRTRKGEENRWNRLKREIKQLETSFESLRKRFIGTIGLIKDGLAFRSDDKTMFVTDRLKDMLAFDTNDFTWSAFEQGLHEDDADVYKNTIRKLSRRSPDYDVSYRYRIGAKIVWVKEYGTLIHYHNRKMVISVCRPVDVRTYPKTPVEVLNRLKIGHDYLEKLQRLNRDKMPFHLICVELRNIPAVNERYGRDIGDLMMGEFLNKIRHHFLKDDEGVFRISGIRFALIIRDERKYSILHRALQHGGELVNFEMQFGGVKEAVYPYFGIQYVSHFDEPVDEMAARSVKALDIALSENHQENYFIIT